MRSIGYALQYAVADPQFDREAVMEAVHYDVIALHYAAADMESERKMVLAFERREANAVRYAMPALRLTPALCGNPRAPAATPCSLRLPTWSPTACYGRGRASRHPPTTVHSCHWSLQDVLQQCIVERVATARLQSNRELVLEVVGSLAAMPCNVW